MATCRVILVTNSTSKVTILSSEGSHLRLQLNEWIKLAGDSGHQIEVPCSSCSCSFPPGDLERCWILYFLNNWEFVSCQTIWWIFRTLQRWSLLWPKRRGVLSPHNSPPGIPADEFFGNPDIMIHMIVWMKKKRNLVPLWSSCYRIAEKSGRNLRRAILMVCATLNST